MNNRTVRSLEFSDPWTVALWLIDSPQDHPLWSQYLAVLVHLRGEKEGVPPTIHLEGATHEWHCFALNPGEPGNGPRRTYTVNDDPEWLCRKQVLWPPNMAYQFRADDDAAAMARVESALNQAPSLDTDYRSWWNQAFADGHCLVRSIWSGQ